MTSFKHKTSVASSCTTPEWKETCIFGLPRVSSLSLTSPNRKGGINDIGVIVMKVKTTSGAPFHSTSDLGEVLTVLIRIGYQIILHICIYKYI